MPEGGRERRRRRRIRTRRAAWINGDAGRRIPCVIWDYSESGARIAAPHASALPDVFTLTSGKDAPRLCQIMWRKSALIGVRYVEPEEINDRPTIRSAVTAEPAKAPTLSIDAIRLAPASESDAATEFPISLVAAGFLCTLIVATVVLYLAHIESHSSAAWALEVCQSAHGMCRHPELPAIASVVMAVVYFTTRGMEF